MLVIHPDECIDCGVCEPEFGRCSKPDTAPGLEEWLSLNAEYAKIWPTLRSESAHPTLRSGRGSQTNSNTSYQIQARVIEADGAIAVQVPGREIGSTDPTGRSSGRDRSPLRWPGLQRSQRHFRSLPALIWATLDTRGKQHDRNSWPPPSGCGLG
jgi:hypothetical protein